MEYFRFDWVYIDSRTQAKVLAPIDHYEIFASFGNLWIHIYLKEFIGFKKYYNVCWTPAVFNQTTNMVSIEADKRWVKTHPEPTLEETIQALKNSLGTILEFDNDDLAKLYWEVH